MKSRLAALLIAMAACSPSSSTPTPGPAALKPSPKGYSDKAEGGWITTQHDQSANDVRAEAAGGDHSERAVKSMRSAGGAATPSAPPSADPKAPSNKKDDQGLRASEVDDNATFDQYLKYHIANGNLVPEGYRLDVSERYVFEVVDEKGRTLPNARVWVSGNDRPLFEGCTDSRGRTGFFPRSIAASKEVTAFQVTAGYGSATKVFEIARTAGGKDDPVRLALPVAKSAAAVQLDLCFLLDTTGSMGDEIARIQKTLLAITAKMRKLESKPRIRLGMVLYRDHGDEYVTRRFDFTEDAEAFDKALREVKADGGGDTPEQLNMGLYAAVEQLAWGRDALRLCFLVADASPHMDYADDVPYVATLRSAVAKGIKVYPTGASGLEPVGSYVMRQIAQFTLANFLFIEYGKSAGGHGVEEGTYQTNNLDDIVLRIVKQELSAYAAP